MEFLIAALVTAVSLLIISRLPLGIEIDSPWKAIAAGVVFGLLNAFAKPVITVLGIPFIIVTLGLFLLVINAIIFGLTAWLVDGFRLRFGIWSALLGAIALSFTNSIVFFILGSFFPSLRVS
jgi:putative membrane protein